jgi:hypothetical protein
MRQTIAQNVKFSEVCTLSFHLQLILEEIWCPLWEDIADVTAEQSSTGRTLASHPDHHLQLRSVLCLPT